jgi:hypothetical protein
MHFVEIAMVYVISCRKTSRNQAKNQPKNSRNQAKKSKFKRPFKKLGLCPDGAKLRSAGGLESRAFGLLFDTPQQSRLEARSP